MVGVKILILMACGAYDLLMVHRKFCYYLMACMELPLLFITLYTTHKLDLQCKCVRYQKMELPWRPKIAKEYRKTAKVIVLGSQLPSKIRQE